MLRISRLTDYATVVMTCLAASSEQVLSAAQIAECTQLELPTVSKLMKQLGHAGLVESFRGANGGYCLARSARDINLAEIIEALEGPLGMTECSKVDGQCDLAAHCGVRSNWQRINQVVGDALKSMSLADMLQPVPVHFPSQPLSRGRADVSTR